MDNTFRLYPLNSFLEIIPLFYKVSVKQQPKHINNLKITLIAFIAVDIFRYIRPDWVSSVKINCPTTLVVIVAVLFILLSNFVVFTLVYMCSKTKHAQINESLISIIKDGRVVERIFFDEVSSIENERFSSVISYNKDNKKRVLVFYYPCPVLIEALGRFSKIRKD